jgi:membrane protease YdiL (CAAX protease family)
MALPAYRTPLIKQGWLRALAFVVAWFVFVIAATLVTGFMVGMAAAKKTDHVQAVRDQMNTPLFSILALCGIAVISILLTWLFRHFIDRRSFNSLGLQWKGSQRDAWIGLSLGPALIGTGSLILWLNGTLRWTDINANGSDLFISIVLFMLVALGEELAFRGYILGSLLESMNKWTALAISSLLFAVAHIDNPHVNIIAVINVVLGGALLGLNYIYTRNLWFAILFHFSWNFFQGPIVGFDVSGGSFESLLHAELTGNPLLTGERFGFEGSIISTVVLAIAFLLFFLVYERENRPTTGDL